jgi:hypothetical protein
VKSCSCYIHSSSISPPQFTCWEETMNADKWHSFSTLELRFCTSMTKKHMSYSWKRLTLCLLVAWSMISSWLCMVDYHQNLKLLMTSRTCKDFRNHQEWASSVTSSGQIQWKMIKDNALRSLCQTM